MDFTSCVLLELQVMRMVLGYMSYKYIVFIA